MQSESLDKRDAGLDALISWAVSRGLDAITAAESLLFAPPRRTVTNRAFTYFASLLLYSFGVVHWCVFLNQGYITFQTGDYAKEIYVQSILRQAICERRVPYAVNNSFHGTNRFMALPWVQLTPQVLILPFVSTGEFVVINVLIVYTVGFWGCLKIKRRYRLSLFSFVILFLLSNFNGYLTARMGIGHMMWLACFFLPHFVVAVLNAVEREPTFADAAVCSVVLFFMFLQGGFHVWVWCLIFLGLIGISGSRRRLAYLVTTALLAGLLSMHRLVPGLLAYHLRPDRFNFASGYPSLAHMLSAFTCIRSHEFYTPSAVEGSWGWHEYDMFVGVLAFAFILWFGVVLRFRVEPTLANERTFRKLDFPLLGMFVLTLASFFTLAPKLSIPLLNSQRTPTRFIIIPFLFLLVIACVRLDRVLPNLRRPLKWLALIGLAQTFFELMNHSFLWRVKILDMQLGGAIRYCSLDAAIINEGPSPYSRSIWPTFAVSVFCLAVVGAYLIGKNLSRPNRDAGST